MTHEREHPTLVFVVTEDWYFLSHRVQLALAAKEMGMRVVVLTGPGQRGQEIVDFGLEHRTFTLNRKSLSIRQELSAVRDLTKQFRALSPDIVHLVAAKPIVYGNIAAKITGCRSVVSAVAGLGYLYLANGFGARAMRSLYEMTFWTLVRGKSHCRVVIQNGDDAELFVRRKLATSGQIILTVGAGVDVDKFKPEPEPKVDPVVVLTHSRMLWDKGIGELVEATRELRRDPSVPPFVVRLIGDPDHANPASIPSKTLEGWKREGVVEWLGRRNDIPLQLANCHIACLPSYREGAPLSLLEAAAAGRPIIATDVPGCREVVSHEHNGLLVPARDVHALSVALKKLILDRGLREQYGAFGRTRAVNEFSSRVINGRIVDCYQELLAPSRT